MSGKETRRPDLKRIFSYPNSWDYGAEDTLNLWQLCSDCHVVDYLL